MSQDLKLEMLLIQLVKLADELNNQPNQKAKKLAVILYFVLGCLQVDEFLENLYKFAIDSTQKNIATLKKVRN